jgi:hypothetical protein
LGDEFWSVSLGSLDGKKKPRSKAREVMCEVFRSTPPSPSDSTNQPRAVVGKIDNPGFKTNDPRVTVRAGGASKNQTPRRNERTERGKTEREPSTNKPRTNREKKGPDSSDKPKRKKRVVSHHAVPLPPARKLASQSTGNVEERGTDRPEGDPRKTRTRERERVSLHQAPDSKKRATLCYLAPYTLPRISLCFLDPTEPKKIIKLKKKIEGCDSHQDPVRDRHS